ncbi:MAG TPA: hypothetical protein VL737_04455 [Candidatus Pristimantibacillus sp.]|jgi:hypothetical protein|nr:hypothetical protein [Candidatus Pristimantibacillus sp.]
MAFRPHPFSGHHRYRRLASHIGVTAMKREAKRRLGKAFWVAGSAAAAAVLVLAAFLIHAVSRPDLSVQTPLVQPANHTAGIKPVTEEIPAAPVATPQTPAPKTTPKAPAQPAFTTSISIEGNDTCRSDTLAALSLLASKAPAHYVIVTKYIGIIRCVTQGSGMQAYNDPPLYLVGDATRNAGTLWYAGTIAHDAGHSKLYHDYLDAHPGQVVPGDVWTGEAAEAACLDAQYDALQQMGAPESTLDYVKGIINSGYWNIPYDQRWW